MRDDVRAPVRAAQQARPWRRPWFAPLAGLAVGAVPLGAVALAGSPAGGVRAFGVMVVVAVPFATRRRSCVVALAWRWWRG
jgi:hypothetical protein